MFRSKIRIHTCRIILLTSLAWLLVDVALLAMYSECFGEGCGKKSSAEKIAYQNPEEYRGKKAAIAAALQQDNIDDDDTNLEENEIQHEVSEDGLFIPPYSRSRLKKWRPAPSVRPQGDSPGELGKAVNIPIEQEKIMLDKFQENHVVIVFHNEAWTTLIRTIWSTINRSPRPLLKEIILVDDASEKEHLGTKLEDYIKTLPVSTRLFRTETRSGLIRARLLGAKHVKVVCPIIDVISDTTFEYIQASDMTWGGFNWKLNFRWYRVPEREMTRRGGDRTAPLRTPTMAGGLFAIDRDYFYKIGSYDEGMDIWGGENLEMSFRVWQCGGILEIAPCSHVGHVFRDKSPYSFPGGVQNIVLHNAARVAEVWMCGGRLEIAPCSHVGHVFRKTTPYSFPGGTGRVVNHNNARLAEVWLDDWKHFYYNINPGCCWWCIRNAETSNCLDTLGGKASQPLGMGYCHGMGGNQVFAYTKRKQVMSDDNCLDAANPRGPIKLIRCHGMRGNQEWTYDSKIRNAETSNCLDTLGGKASQPLGMGYCHGMGGNQVFAYTKRKQVMSDDNCLDAANPRGPIKLIRCHGMRGNQEWTYDSK
ncbi:Uncharacterized protein OBRU01_08336, partial [Operophtera brumata]